MTRNILHSYVGRRQLIQMGLGAAGALAILGLGASPLRSARAESAVSYTAGTYTSQGEGRKGKVSVEVVFSDTAIEAIGLGENMETPRIAQAAARSISQQVLATQSLAVDAVSGATFSSNAILTAIEDCVAQAGGDVDALKAVPATPKSNEKVELDADIVVIGGGGAGMGAAMYAAQHGAKVAVFEKNGYFGGNVLVSGGFLHYVDAPEELRATMTDGLRGYFEDIMAAAPERGYDQAIIDNVRVQYEEYSASSDKVFGTLDWFALWHSSLTGGAARHGASYANGIAAHDFLEWMEQDFGVEWAPLTSVVGFVWPLYTKPKGTNGGEGYMDAFDEKMTSDAMPIDILFSTPATEILTDDSGRTVGARGVCSDGTEYTVNAGKAVIVATGGFSGNPDMLREYDVTWGLADIDYIPTTNIAGHTGDGIRMAETAGAAVNLSGNFMFLPFTNTLDNSIESVVGDTSNALFVNVEGKRFVDESKTRNEISAAIMQQPQSMGYIISDARNALIGDDGLNMWGTSAAKLLEYNQLFMADTIEELAEQVGMDPSVLLATVEGYNASIDAGEDPEFGRSLLTEEGKIIEAPFYASPCTWAAHITYDGISADATGQVLNADGQPIEGLFAAGEVRGMPGVGSLAYGMNLAKSLIE